MVEEVALHGAAWVPLPEAYAVRNRGKFFSGLFKENAVMDVRVWNTGLGICYLSITLL